MRVRLPVPSGAGAPRLRLSIANPAERVAIARARHDVYVSELGQYAPEDDGLLYDAEGVESTYLIATQDGELVGFVGVTPPASPRFSLERHVPRSKLPFASGAGLFEIRALTVVRPARGTVTAGALMYAALRFAREAGGERIVAAGRHAVIDLYLRMGLERVGISFTSGAVPYELLSATLDDVEARARRFDRRLRKLEDDVDWQLPCAFSMPMACYHGGASFDAIGDRFDDLSRADTVIAADVLDAWYPPAPAVLDVLREHVEWIARTSPPTQALGFAKSIAHARNVDDACILAGGGSSQLIFLAMQTWLDRSSRVLVLDPMYGEYAHVLQHIVGCRMERFPLRREDGYRVDPEALRRKLTDGFDLLVVVNPNNPTGRHVHRAEIEWLVRESSPALRVWIDETYVEYAGPGESLETFAACSKNTFVCKSMSKIYALSGLRAGYLCGPRVPLAALRPLLPPWSVSLAAQLAGTRALQSVQYYENRVRETLALREAFVRDLMRTGITGIVPGTGNFVMFHLPSTAPAAAEVVETCRTFGLYIRNVRGMGTTLGDRAVRIAIKDAATNARILAIVSHVLGTSTLASVEA